MARKKGTTDLAEWTDRLSRAKAFRTEKAESAWEISRQQFELLLPTDTVNAGKDIRVNMAFPTIKVLLRASYSQDPFIYVRDVQPWHRRSAEILQYLENRLWSMQKRKKIMRRIILDALLLKVGYGMTHIVQNPRTERNEVMLSRVSPYDLWLEPGCMSVNDAYYAIRRVIMSRSEAKELWPSKYTGLKAVSSYEMLREATATLPARSDKFVVPGMSDGFERVEVYEIHDQYNREISIISPDCDSFLAEPRSNPYPLDTLFTELIFNEIIDAHYGIGDLEPTFMQQEELDRVRSAMMTHTKRFNRKYTLQKGLADNEAKEAIESGEDGAIIELDDVNGLQPVQDAQMSGDVYNYFQSIRNDHREITGVNEYMMASQMPGTKTAYETQQITQGGNARASEKPDLVGDFCEEVAYKDIEIMKQLYPDQQVMKWVGPDGQEQWRQIQQWELQGEHYVSIHAGSTQPRDDAVDFQRGMLLYQTFGQDPTIPHEALLEVVMQMMNIRDKDFLLGKTNQQGMPAGQQPQGGQPQGPGGAASLPGGAGNQYGMPGAPQVPGMPGGMNPMSNSLPQATQLMQLIQGGRGRG